MSLGKQSYIRVFLKYYNLQVRDDMQFLELFKVADVANDSVESQPSHKAVFRTISNLDCKNIGQFATRVAIVVPKVKCDKGTTVSASEIIRETACHPALVNYNILRRRVCMTVCPKTFKQLYARVVIRHCHWQHPPLSLNLNFHLVYF
jgi:hypothetical protein